MYEATVRPVIVLPERVQTVTVAVMAGSLRETAESMAGCVEQHPAREKSNDDKNYGHNV